MHRQTQVPGYEKIFADECRTSLVSIARDFTFGIYVKVKEVVAGSMKVEP